MRIGRSFALVLGTSCWMAAMTCVAQAAPAPTLKPAVKQASAPSTPARGEAIGPEEWKRRLEAASKQLRDGGTDGMEQAISELLTLGGRDAALCIMERLHQGLPPQLIEQGVEALGILNQPVTSPILVELTLHRRWQIRQKAVLALGALQVRSAVSVVLYALDDPSPEVRSAAAQVLGDLGDPRAIPALTAAATHGVEEAYLSLAKLGNAKQVAPILQRAQKDVKAAEPALRILLGRNNFPVASKVALVNAVKALGNPQADEVLGQWRSAFGKGTAEPLLAALAMKGAKS